MNTGLDTEPRSSIEPHAAVVGWLGLTLGLVACRTITTPASGLDLSWITGLNMARSSGLTFGRSLVFTYGPWGFLDFPQITSRAHIILGVVFASVAVSIAYCAVYLGLRRHFGRAFAGGLSAAVIIAISTSGLSIASFFVLSGGAALSVLHLRGDLARVNDRWFLPTMAAVSALLVQVKFSEGLVLAAVVAVAAVCARSVTWRSLMVVAASYVGGFVAAWSIAGQSVRDFFPWLSGSLEVAVGFGQSMAYEIKPNLSSYAIAVASFVALGYLAWHSTGERSLRSRLGILLIVFGSLFFAFKQGFTRHDNHELAFFALSAVLMTVLVPRPVWPRWAFPTLGILVVLSASSWSVVDPLTARDSWRNIAQTLVDSDYQQEAVASAAERARASYALPQSIVDVARGRPVAIDPWEVTMAWAYSFEWRPVPVFQTYSAYTHALDVRNADFVVSSADDQVFIRPATPLAIDGRNPLWDSPDYMLALACHFRPAAGDQSWVALTKVGNQCQAPAAVNQEHVKRDAVVSLPKVDSDQILIARFFPDEPSIAVRLGHLAVKDFSPLMVTADGNPFRLPDGLAGGALIVALPAGTGLTSADDHGIDYSSLAFSVSGELSLETIDVGVVRSAVPGQ